MDFQKRDVVSAERNPAKIHRPVFRGKGKVWSAKRVVHGVRKVLKNPKIALPPTKELEHLPPANVYTVASSIFGVFATGGTGAGFMLLSDTVAEKVKAGSTAKAAYGPVRDAVRLASEGILGISIYPYIAGQVAGKDIGKAFWLGGTILTGIDLGVTVFKYVAKAAMAARDKAMPTAAPAPAAQEAGMALIGLAGLNDLISGVKTGINGVKTPESGQSPESPISIEGMDGMDGAMTDEMMALNEAKAKFHELSSLIQGPDGVDGHTLIQGGGSMMMGRLVK